jgi:tetratricopeptide (TPR) repeat protein
MRGVKALLLVAILSVGCSSSDGPNLDDADRHFIAAEKAMAAGDKEQAIKELDASIAVRPTSWAYFKRGQLHAAVGNDQQAQADVQKGLELNPEDKDLKWLEKELKKPATRRFKGAAGQPPGMSK